MSEWTEYVTKFYNEKKEQDKNYSFKQALKDASKERKKQKEEPKKAVKTIKKTKKNKSEKSGKKK